MPASVSAIARRLDFIRETEGANRGYWVAFVLRFTGNVEGESWCAAFTSLVLDIAYKGKSPGLKSASTIAQLNYARMKGWVVKTPRVDDVFFYVHDDGTPHHTGFVTSLSPLSGIAGNTSELGTSSDGTGVFEHALNVSLSHVVFVRYP